MSSVVVVFIACVVACAVGHVAILHSVVRKGTASVASEVPRPHFLVELVWAAIPMLVLALVLTATWAKVRQNSVPQPAMIMKVAR